MQKRTSLELALLLCLPTGCSTMLGTSSPNTAQTPSSAVWVQNPRAYEEDISSNSDHERARLRAQALSDFLSAPGPEQQVRLNLVFDASVASLADAYAAADTLAHALGNSATLPPETHAVLTGLLIRMEKRVDDLRAIASRESELQALRDAYQTLEQSKAAADAQHAAAQRALREAQAKLDALKSIEQTLESNTPQPATGEIEPKPDSNP